MDQTLLAQLPDYPAIEAGYRRMWAAGRPELMAGAVTPDPVPDDSSMRWGVSIVAHFDPVFAGQLETLAAQGREWCGENHTFYNAGNLHTTVRSCEFFRREIARADPRMEIYRRSLAEVCRQCGPFEIAYSGLNGNHTGIICQGYPVGPSLQQLRRSLHQKFMDHGVQHGPEATRPRLSAHVSLTVFGGPLKSPRALAGWIESQRRLDVGVARISHLTLVRYHRTLHDVVPVAVSVFALGGSTL